MCGSNFPAVSGHQREDGTDRAVHGRLSGKFLSMRHQLEGMYRPPQYRQQQKVNGKTQFDEHAVGPGQVIPPLDRNQGEYDPVRRDGDEEDGKHTTPVHNQ